MNNAAATAFFATKTDAELFDMLEVLEQDGKWDCVIEDAVASALYQRHNVEDAFWANHLDEGMTVREAIRKAIVR